MHKRNDPWMLQQRFRQVRVCSHIVMREVVWFWVDRILNIFCKDLFVDVENSRYLRFSLLLLLFDGDELGELASWKEKKEYYE